MRRDFLRAGMAVVAMPWALGRADAQSEDWAKVLEAARKEGEVIVWGQAGEQRRRFWKDTFEKAHPGITVKLFQPNTSSERDTRFLRELEAKVAKVDVLVSGSGALSARLRPAGALQPLRPLLRPEILDARNWSDGEPHWYDIAKQYIISSDLSVGIAAVANMAMGENELKSWKDLLDAKWDRKIASLDPRLAGMAYPQSLFQFASPNMGPDYIRRLYTNGRVVFASEERQLLEWVESGRVAIALAVRESEVTALQKVGAKIRVIPTLEAGGVQQGIVAGSEGSAAVPNITPLPHPNAARVYLNWMFSREGQQALVDILGLASTHKLVDQSKLNPVLRRVEGVKYTVVNDERLYSAAATREMRDTVTRTIEGR